MPADEIDENDEPFGIDVLEETDPPKILPHACFLLPVRPDGCVVLAGLAAPNLDSYLSHATQILPQQDKQCN